MAEFWAAFKYFLFRRSDLLYVLIEYGPDDEPQVSVSRSLDKLRAGIKSANTEGRVYWVTTVEA